MESKYKSAASQLYSDFLEVIKNDTRVAERLSDYEVTDLMCKLAEEVEKECKLTLHELNVKLEDNMSDEIKRDILEFNDTLYTKEQVEAILEKQYETFIEKVELIENMRTNGTVCIDKFNKDCDYYINKDSILDAKLEL